MNVEQSDLTWRHCGHKVLKKEDKAESSESIASECYGIMLLILVTVAMEKSIDASPFYCERSHFGKETVNDSKIFFKFAFNPYTSFVISHSFHCCARLLQSKMNLIWYVPFWLLATAYVIAL